MASFTYISRLTLQQGTLLTAVVRTYIGPEHLFVFDVLPGCSLLQARACAEITAQFLRMNFELGKQSCKVAKVRLGLLSSIKFAYILKLSWIYGEQCCKHHCKKLWYCHEVTCPTVTSQGDNLLQGGSFCFKAQCPGRRVYLVSGGRFTSK